MAFVTPKNLFSPLTNKTILFLWIFIALLFAVARSSGTKLSIHNVQIPQPSVKQQNPAMLPNIRRQQAVTPKLNANTNDSYLPFGFDGLNKEQEEKAEKPTSGGESLDDIYNQM